MASSTQTTIQLEEKATQSLLDWALAVDHSERSYLEKGAALARRLGAHYRED